MAAHPHPGPLSQAGEGAIPSPACGRRWRHRAFEERPFFERSMAPDEGSAKRDFIVANTRRVAPPLVPEIRLRLADEAVPIWKKTEEDLGAMGLPPPFWAFAWAGGQALARYALDNPDLARGKRLLDFASG